MASFRDLTNWLGLTSPAAPEEVTPAPALPFRVDAVQHPMAQPIVPVFATDPFRTKQDFYNYLSGIREDSLLDGTLGGAIGRAGGGWTNCVTGMGTFGRDKVMQGRYDEPFKIDDPQLSSLYNGNDIAQRIVAAKPKEMFRRGWVLVFAQKDSQAITEPEDRGATGSESGPAAPGSPLVDPMGAAPGQSDGKPPTKPVTDDPQSGKPVRAPDDLNKIGGAGDLGQQPDNAMAKPTPSPSKAAPGAERSTPMGESQKTPQKNVPATPPSAGTKPAKTPPKPPASGPETQGEGADLADQVEKYAANLGLIPRMLEATIFGRLYGGGLLVLGADDGRDMALPLDETNIKTMRYLAWIDRRFVFAATWYAEIGPKYGEVETWEIVNPFGGQTNTRVHESRVIRFDGAQVDFLMRRRLLGWSLSVLQAPYDVMRQFDQSFQSIANLMIDMSQAVMKINRLAQLIANDQKTLNTRMTMVDMARSSGRMLYIDAENEEFKREPTPLTGVADTLEMQMLRIAAAAEMPVAILFGREPSGLNATGDADFRRFYDTIAGEQKNYIEPRLRRAYAVMCAAKDSPTSGQVPDMQFVWHKLYEPSEKEQAEIRWLMAQADEKYVQNEVVMPEEIATSRFRSGDLNLDTEIDLDLRREKQATMQLPPSGAEKAQQDQQNKQAEMQLKATALAAKPAGPDTGKASPGKGSTPPAGQQKTSPNAD